MATETSGIPQEALNRGVRALRALPYPHWEIAPEQVVRVVLRAAIPALAEAVQAEYYGWFDLGSRSSTQPVIVTPSDEKGGGDEVPGPEGGGVVST